MTTLVIANLKASELPAQWAQRLDALPGQTVTVRIETEAQPLDSATDFVTDDPAFGIWKDRGDVSDVHAFVRDLRSERYNHDGSCGKA